MPLEPNPQVTGLPTLRRSDLGPSQGRITQSSLAPGTNVARTASFTYDANDNVTSTVFGAAGTVATERVDGAYDDASRLTSTTVFGDGPATYVTNLVRDDRGVVTAVTDPRGHVPGGSPNPAFTTTFATNPAGLPTRTTSPPVAVEEWGGSPSDQQQVADVGYNTFGEVTHARDVRGNVTTTSYDVLGRPTQSSGQPYTPPGGSAITPTESWTYDSRGNVLTHTDRRGETTTAVYDRLGRPVAVTDPQVGSAAAGVTRAVYDDVGNVVSTVDQLGAWTFFAYDDLDRVWARTQTERSPVATFTTYTDHNDAGDVTRVLLPSNVGSGASRTAVYNAAGDLVESRDEANELTTYGYDVAGRVASVTDPLGRIARFTYDRAGRQTAVAQFSPSNVQLRSTSTAYDAAGNPTSTTDAMGWTTTATYDAVGQLRTFVEPVDASTTVTSSFGYAKGGLLTRATDGRGNRTLFTYNSLNLRWETIEASTTAHPNVADRKWAVSYDAGGLPVAEVAPGGVTSTRTFDELGRLAAESGSGGGSIPAARSVGYDLAGQVTSVDHPSGSQAFTYNDRGLVTGASGNGGTSSFGYDVNGRMSSRADPGTYSTFGYNARGDLTNINGGALSGNATLSYDDARQLSSVTYASPGAVRTFGYDHLGRTTSDTVTGPGGVLRAQSYTYDANDNRLTTTVSPGTVAAAGTQSYTYDRSDRLTSWTDPASVTTAYTWDAAGNRLTAGGATAVYDQRNRLVSDGTATYAWTARGTLSTRTAGSTTTTTVFDAFDRLVADNASGATTYAYDGLDRLAVRNGSVLTYVGLEKEPVCDNTSAYARDPDGDLVSVGSTAGDWAVAADTHGDVVAAFPVAGGSLTDDRSYDPFGVVLDAGHPNLKVGYQGSWTDPTTGKVSAQARWYTPGTGGFASRDSFDVPFSGAVSANRYLYGNANPLAYNDPTGHIPPLVLAGIVVAPAVVEGVGIATAVTAGALGGVVLGERANENRDSSEPDYDISGSTAAAATQIQTLADTLRINNAIAARAAAEAAVQAPAITFPAPAVTVPVPRVPRRVPPVPSAGGAAGGAASAGAAGVAARVVNEPLFSRPAVQAKELPASAFVAKPALKPIPSGDTPLRVPDRNQGKTFVPPVCNTPGQCISNAVAVAAAAGGTYAGSRPDGPEQPQDPAEALPLSNGCADTTGALTVGIYESCSPAPAGWRCTQTGNPHSDRIDPTRSYVCAINPEADDPPAPSATDSGSRETYYRTMSQEHFDALVSTGRLPATAETFISPTERFSESYEGVLVRFTVRGGTYAALANIGVRDTSTATAANHPDMPLVSRGWGNTSAFFKGEGQDHVNIGLGRGRALDTFNDAITGFERLR